MDGWTQIPFTTLYFIFCSMNRIERKYPLMFQVEMYE